MKMKEMYFKKFMSVFMAALMLLSCWVWIAPEKASAAAGSYYVRVYYYLVDRGINDPFIGDNAIDYTGPTMTTASAGVTLYHVANNGTSTITSSTDYNMKSLMFDDDGTDNVNINSHISFSSAGFPTSIQFFAKAAVSNYGEWYFTKITVAASSTATEHTLWEGKVGCEYGGSAWQGEISPSGFNSIRQGSGDWTQTSDASGWVYPYADTSTASWSKTPEAMTCPETGTHSQEVAVTVKDQYGVQMFDPTWTVKGSSCGTNGISVDPSTSSETTTIELTNAANVAGTTNSQTGTVTATWSTPNSTGNTSKTSSKTFTINDSSYTATFTGHTDANGVVQEDYKKDYQHGMTPVAPDAYSYQDGDYDVTFTRWNPSVGAITSDTTYTAVYSRSDKILADYTAVDAAITAANQLKTDLGAEYELMYTQESRLAVESAIDAVVTGLGRTQQTVVDGYAQAINDAIAALEPNTFNVIFLDENDKILLFETDVEYKASVTPPADEDGYYDSTNHYTFSGWSTDEYQSVKSDLFVYPVYTAEAHIFTTTTVASTCTQAGGTLYECSCGYSYVVGETDPDAHVWEADYTIDLEPTCTVAGSKSIHCTLCDATKERTEIPATGHSWGEESEVVAPSCTSSGINAKVCKVCDACEHTTVSALTHDYAETVVAPTCTTKGYTEYVCRRTDCGHSYTGTYTDVIDHSFGEWEEVHAAACEVKGTEKRTCTECGFIELRSTEALTHDVPDDWTVVVAATCEGTGYQTKTCTRCGVVQESQVIPATGHSNTTETKAATCTEAGYTKVVCSTCGKTETTIHQPLGHSYDEGVHSEADCTHGGFTPYTCSVCGDTYNVYDETKPATGHTYVEGTSTATCTAEGKMTLTCACGVTTTVNVPALGHYYVKDETASTEATCADAATETYKCSRCTDSYTVSVGDKSTEHTWGGWQVKQSATEDSIGYQTNTCTVCGQIKVETIEATGEHKFTDGEIVVSKEATCTEDGYEERVCSTHTGDDSCGKTSGIPLPATGHTETLSYTPATCAVSGSTKIVCSVCDDVIEEKEILTLGHAWGDGEVTLATCKDTGKIVYTCTRTDCDGTYEQTLPINEDAHLLSTTVKDATCEDKGSVVTSCSICGKTETTTLAAKGHTFTGEENITKAASCTEDGSKTVKCVNANCDEATTVVIARTGHTWGEWEVTKASTNTEKGEISRSCQTDGCTETETVEIPAGGHNLVASGKTDATCAQKGSVTYDCDAHTGDEDCGITIIVTLDEIQHTLTISKTDAKCEKVGEVVTTCENCGNVSIRTEIPATGHSYEGIVTTPATCTTEGEKTYTCAHDATHTYTEVIAKLQHNYVAGEEVKATCTSGGYTPYECETCDSSYVLITDNAKGHTFEEGDSTADCTTAGTMTLKCACGAEMTAAVPALGHDYKLDSTTEATCAAAATETYKCSACGDSYTVSVGSKTTNHDWNDWETVEQATYTSIGYKTRTCKICDKLEVETLQKTGDHNLVEVKREEATCEEDGYIDYDCSVHTDENDCGVTDRVTIPATGHTEELSYSAATCAADGSAKTVCTVCKETIEENTISALGHVWGNEKVTFSTCSEKGKVEFTCTRCNTETKTVEIAENPDAHSYITATTPVSCTQDGSAITSCILCGDELVKTTIPMTGHNWADWEETQAATNTEKGEMSRSCQNSGCTETETVEIPAGGHSFGTAPSSTTPASCTQEGVATYNCIAHTSCGVTITVTLEKTQHTIKTDSEAASCTNGGYVKTFCSVCDDEVYTDMTIGKLAHEFEEIATVEPTCTKSGYTTYKCKNCEESYNEIGADAKGHTYEEVEGSSTATCTVAGKMTLKCACGAEMTATVPALGHDYKLDSTTEATCAAAATQTYDCSRCEAAYTISAGSKTDNHDFDDWTVVEKATETSLGYETRECKVCGKLEVQKIEATGEHKFTIKIEAESKEATCEEAGYETYGCSVHTDCTEKSVIDLPKLGHTEKHMYSAATCTGEGLSAMVCDVCGKTLESAVIPVLGHSWGAGTVTSQPTCSDEGEISYECSRTDCGATKTEKLPTSGHALTTTTVDAKCEEDGSVVTVCDNCDYKETTVINKKGHTWSDTPSSSTNATCEAEGSKVYDCENCDEQKTVTVPKLGHTYVVGDEVAPTCTTSGYTVYVCENDSAHIYNVYDADKPATGHTWGEWVVDTYATEETDGLKVRECACGKTEEEVIPAMKHNMTEQSRTEPACDKEGEIVYKCSVDHEGVVCSYTLTVTLEKLAHTLITSVTDAECEKVGEVVTTCENCGNVNIRTEIPATGHSYAGKVTTEATCTAEGEKTYTCAHDATHTYTEAIAKLQHNYVAGEEVEATCTSNGYIPYTCSACGDSYAVITSASKGHTYEEIEGSSTATCTVAGTMTLKCTCSAEMTAAVPALGHDYQPGASTAATCAAAATQSYDCSRCDAAYTVSVGSKTENHKWGEWKIVENATEASLGYETRECTVCGQLEVKTISATGEHKFTIYVADESKAPSCDEAGYEVYRCSVNTDCTETSKVVVPATGHTKTQSYVAPNCENAGISAVVCSVCGETLESAVVPALGHSWSAGVITKQPGCFTEGEITYSCSRTDCNATKTEAVQPTGHIWDNGKVITESACTVGGEKLFKCTGCDATYTKTLNPLGHSYGRVVTPSTCTEQGYTTYTCVNCRDAFVTSYTDASGHSIGTWVTTKEASCTEDGERIRYCSACDYYETEAIPASEHSWGEWRLIGADVCAEGAIRQRECTPCGAVERDVLEDGEHFYRTDENGNIIFDNILMPACEHEGFYVYRCTLCGSEVKFTSATPGYEEELAATGHNWQTDANGDIVYVTVKAVTCFTDGQKYRTCSNENCNLDENREYITVATVGHQLKSMSGKDASCEESGYSNYYVCVACGYEHNKVIYSALGHIDENADGVCESCKASIDADNTGSNSSEDCDCMCHKGGFMGIIYKIVSFFWKLFGTNKTCDCGEAHY